MEPFQHEPFSIAKEVIAILLPYATFVRMSAYRPEAEE
jgi:hypothetical protein